MDTDIPDPQPEPEPNPSTIPTTSPPPQPLPSTTTSKPLPRRPAPVPTRSSIAQSSFSWMLEPDGTQASSPLSSSYPASSNPSPSNGSSSQGHGQGHKKRPSSGRRNNKNAFLFGEVVSSESEGEGVRRGEIFGLKTMGK